MRIVIVSFMIMLFLAVPSLYAEESIKVTTSQDLLNEIIKLRTTIERISSANSRALILFERIKVQNDQILLARNMIEKISDDIANMEMSKSQSVEQLRNMQGRLDGIRDETSKNIFIEEMANLKMHTEHLDKQINIKSSKLLLLESELNEAMRKYAELISRLDYIDNDMKQTER